MKKLYKYLIVFLIIVVSVWSLIVIFNLITKKSENLGIKEGRLAPCPNKPNCVSSYETETQHKIAPFAYGKIDKKQAKDKFKQIIQKMPRTKIVTEQENYLHIECSTLLMRYVDDLELYFAEDVIHVRSASRVGHSDFGVNRKRVEAIRQKWQNLKNEK